MVVVVVTSTKDAHAPRVMEEDDKDGGGAGLRKVGRLVGC